MKSASKHLLIIILSSISLLTHSQDSTFNYPFQNPELNTEIRINDLITRLSLEEKVSLMLYNSPAIERLDIPSYNWWNECLHGVARAGKATVFPQAIGLAATFDPELIHKIAIAISDEARAKYNAAIIKDNRTQYTGLTFWTPNINIFRDPRWGRGQETYGEDPFLTSRIGESFVSGLQGNDPKYLKTAACAKHYVVHSGPENIRHEFNAIPGKRDFYEVYMPAFKALVDTGVEAIMCAYNRTYDEPCCGSPFLLKDILRDQWGFKGHIVSDCWALDDFWAKHKIVNDKIEAAAMAARAGVNVNCGYIYNYLPEAVEQGLITEAVIDSNLSYLMRTRFKLGLFDPSESCSYNNIPTNIVNCDLHRDLAYEAAAESIVLMKNKNNVLPLDKNKIKRLFVTGPTAFNNDALVGNYNGFSGNMVTFLEGIINKVDEGTIVDYSRGCLLNTDSIFHGFWEARRSDISIAVIGLTRMLEGEEGDAMLANGGDRESITLPPNQIEFIRKLKDNINDKPLIVVITGGSPIAIPEITEMADAVLYAWYPGEQGGNALADILFGDVNPSGRLPVTIYKSIEDLPPFDDYNMENRTYRYFQGKALFPFGYGLSYSEFEYDNATINKHKFNADEKVNLEIMVSNNSEKGGSEVIQVYIRKLDPAYFRPIKMLAGFKRVYFPGNSNKTVKITIDTDELKYWDENEEDYRIEEGEYEMLIGSSSENIYLTKVFSIK